ncbi:MAG: alpha/beta hydrolase [Rubrivivax sp.]|nr:alpha/beta hydrolase [Rubrivivax sp.]
MIKQAQDAAERHLNRPDGVRLRWFRHGPARAASAPEAAPLLLLHGLASNASRFEEFCEHSTLARHRPLLRVDLRGHGGSLTRGRLNTETWCDDLDAVLEAEGAAQAFVVGHSMGAQVALHLAARHPHRVAGLVLIDPVFRQALHGRPHRIAQSAPLLRLAAAGVRAANGLGLHRGALPPLDLRAMDQLAREALANPDPAAEAAFIARYSSMRADLAHVPLAVYLQDMVEMFRAVPAPGALPMPVLALLSSGATFAEAAAMQAALAGPRVRIEAIHCHHWPLTERPAEVRAAIEAWVESEGR